MKKKYNVLLFISIILNIVLGYALSFETAFFNETHLWTPYAMETGGVLVFNNEKEQPDTKKYVQYFKFRCDERNCMVEEIVLSDKSYIHNYLYTAEVLKLSYDDKEAVLRHKDCVFTVTSGATTFNCTQGNETGTLGSHIGLHYKQHGLFNFNN